MQKNFLRGIYEVLAAGVAYVAVKSPNGEESIGSAFHIGEGIFITARHVIEGKKILEIATTERAIKDAEDENGDGQSRKVEISHWPGKGKVIGGPYFHPNPDIDVAALKVEGIDAPVIPLGDHLDDWLGTELVLRDVVVLGYPPIPFSRTPTLVASKAEVNAIVDKYTGGHPHFILSAIARGGFSGGPAITDYGCSLGVITESLGTNDQPPELGYLSVLTVEPIFDCLAHHKIVPSEIDRIWEGFWNTKSSHFTDKNAPIGYQHISVDIYRGTLGLYLKIYCHNQELLKKAIHLATTSVKQGESKIEEIHETMSKIHFDKENVSEEKVITAYKNINTMFIESGLEANYIYPEYNL